MKEQGGAKEKDRDYLEKSKGSWNEKE